MNNTGLRRPKRSAEQALILIVDDETDWLTYLFDLLAFEGFTVAAASNSTEALRCIHRKNPRVVISKIKLPDMQGAELIQRIKGISSEIGIILLSSQTDGFPDLDDLVCDAVIPKLHSRRHEIVQKAWLALERSKGWTGSERASSTC